APSSAPSGPRCASSAARAGPPGSRCRSRAGRTRPESPFSRRWSAPLVFSSATYRVRNRAGPAATDCSRIIHQRLGGSPRRRSAAPVPPVLPVTVRPRRPSALVDQSTAQPLELVVGQPVPLQPADRSAVLQLELLEERLHRL